MAHPFYNWSQTASSNASADSTVNWAEGQSPSSVNDSARAMMASTAAFRDDIAGAITTGGSATAYTVTSYQVFDTLAHLNGQMIAFVPHATSTNAVAVDVTLNVDSLGAKSVRAQPGVALPTGSLILGTPYVVTYNNSDGVFYLRGMTNPYTIPLGGMIDYFGTSSPSSSLVFPSGQAISRTTYATLFSLCSTTFGSGDGSTTFNIPDLRGRVVAGKDDMGGSAANRLTNAGSGLTGTTLGAAGGAQNQTLVTANLPPYTPAGSVASSLVNGGSAFFGYITPGTNVGVGGTSTGGSSQKATDFLSVNSTFTGTAQGGTSTPVATIPPAIVCNKLLRVI